MKKFLRWLGSLVATIGMFLVFTSGCTRENPSGRNVVLICFDTVRADAFAREPAGGRLAQWESRGVRFTNAHSAAPWTVPSVASVLTGVYPPSHRTGKFAAKVADLDALQPSGLPNDVPSIGELLSKRGFETKAFISNPWLLPPVNLVRGFESAVDVPTRAVVAQARRWLASRRTERPFFLYLHLMDAHGDDAPDTKRQKAASLPANEREELVARAPGRTCEQPQSELCTSWLSYNASIETQKTDLAVLLDDLRARHLLSTTLVILYSDHGEEFGDHAAEERARGADPREAYGLGHGQSLYEELLHVPLIVWDPAATPREESALVSLVDIVPTILSHLQISLDAIPGLAGIPLDRPEKSRTLFASGIAYGPEQWAALQDSQKEIDISCPATDLTFDLSADPKERLATGGGGDLHERLARYLRSEGGALTIAQISEDQRRALRSIGYMNGHKLRASLACRSETAVPRTTIGVYDSSTATFYLRESNTQGPVDRQVPFGITGDVPVVGDWNGDHQTDLGVFRQSTGTFYLALSPSSTREVKVTGMRSGDVPITGDWNGDGKFTPGYYRPVDSSFHLRNDLNTGPPTEVVQFGKRGDVPLVGDWIGDGVSRVGVFQRSGATFVLRLDGSDDTEVTFGLESDVPLAGDWNGDRKTTIGVWRAEHSNFFLRDSLTTGDPDRHVMFPVEFESKTLVPIAGQW